MIVWPPDFPFWGGHGPLAPPPGYATDLIYDMATLCFCFELMNNNSVLRSYLFSSIVVIKCPIFTKLVNVLQIILSKTQFFQSCIGYDFFQALCMVGFSEVTLTSEHFVTFLKLRICRPAPLPPHRSGHILIKDAECAE